jgi:hypothetical protein
MKNSLKLQGWLLALFLIVLSIATITLIILTVSAVTNKEGIATIIFLVIYILVVIVFPSKHKQKATLKSIIGVAIVFISFMGGILDLAGNKLMNAPIEKCLCDKNEELKRTVYHSRIGSKSSSTTEFTCENMPEKKSRKVSNFSIIGIRMVEYVVIGLILLLTQQLIWKIYWSKLKGDDKDNENDDDSNAIQIINDEVIINQKNNSFTRIIKINLRKK